MNLAKVYTPSDYERKIYQIWEQSGAFTPSPASPEDSFSMTLPPPNANADLHTGHALDFQLKDVIGRYQRSRGKQVLLLPGADHAGFETWYVYENKLSEQGKSRFDFSRDELYQQVYDFVALNRGVMEDQVRSLGISCDWSKFTFTLDDKVVTRAYSTFKKMWDEGLIYRGERLVNYCTKHHTGFSDIEVDYEERKSPLYYMKYGPFELATTRPETKFGDTAVAVHPDDERYKDLVDTVIEIEGLNGPVKLRVVADELVDPEFGTGAVKVTPAHDFNDWEIAERHNLKSVRVINHDGKLNKKAGKYEGLTVLEAREKVVEDLKNRGLLVKVDTDYVNRVGVCYKCGTTIEPMLMKQWFVSMKPLAQKAADHLDQGQITFYPNKKMQEVKAYLSDIKDWNISRQIAWGIPIPVFQNLDDEDDWIYDERVHEEEIEIEGRKYRRDPDVFDTWWSSGQWPYATLDYPSKESDQFYPTSLMETGTDLLRQWVSRMIILGVYITGDVPFKEVYFHGMVLDEHGAKMSKSKGNVLNPLKMVQEYGSDALRIGLLTGTSAGSPQPFGIPKVIGGRNFCNKLWNMARYTQNVLEGQDTSTATPVSQVDHWIVSKLEQTKDAIESQMSSYRVGEAFECVYHFVRDDMADWYLEASKEALNPGLLKRLLIDTLKIVHPFAPFLTEAIWQEMGLGSEENLLIAEPWPAELDFDTDKAEEFEEVQRIVSESRFIIKTLDENKPRLYYSQSKVIDDNKKIIMRMAGVGDVASVEQGRGMHLTSPSTSVWLDIDRVTAKSYVSKLEQDIAKQSELIGNLKNRLANADYLASAPQNIVQQSRDNLVVAEDKLSKLEIELSQFQTAIKGV